MVISYDTDVTVDGAIANLASIKKELMVLYIDVFKLL